MEKGVKVLVVDDEKVLRELLKQLLEAEGYLVEAVASGSEALKLLAQKEFDLVFSDVKMPGIDGFELLKHIKAKYPDVGVIMVTGYSEAYTMQDALMLGADEYITKPFKINEINVIVERAYWRLLSMRNRHLLAQDTGAKV